MSRARKGSVLMLVVWSVTLLGILVIGLARQGSMALSTGQRIEAHFASAGYAAAGLQRAFDALAEDTTQDLDAWTDVWANRPEWSSASPVGKGTVAISVPPSCAAGSGILHGLCDEERKLNLNTAPASVLAGLLVALGASVDDARIVADSVEDWRDTDQDEHPYGAEDFYYKGQQNPYACKDGPFESLEELRLVRGMNPVLFARTAPYVTVFGSGKLNLNTADMLIISALGFTPKGLQAFREHRAGQDGQTGTGDDAVFTSATGAVSDLESVMPVPDLGRLSELVQEDLVGVSAEAFSLAIVASSREPEGRTAATAVIDRFGRVLQWSEW